MGAVAGTDECGRFVVRFQYKARRRDTRHLFALGRRALAPSSKGCVVGFCDIASIMVERTDPLFEVRGTFELVRTFNDPGVDRRVAVEACASR